MLIALILVAAVANLNLAVANVALPDIGKAFDAGQTALNLVAVGYSLGLAASVLYLGALGDRYGRKLMLVLGTALAIPACAARRLRAVDRGAVRRPAARRPRRRHGLPDDARADHRAVVGAGAHASRSRCGRASAARSPRSARCCRARCSRASTGARSSSSRCRSRWSRWSWRCRYVPAHVNEATDPVDNLGGILSVLLVAALVLAINFAPVPNEGALAIGLGVIALAAGGAFVSASAGRAAAVRPRRGRPADLLGRGVRRASSCSAR